MCSKLFFAFFFTFFVFHSVASTKKGFSHRLDEVTKLQEMELNQAFIEELGELILDFSSRRAEISEQFEKEIDQVLLFGGVKPTGTLTKIIARLQSSPLEIKLKNWNILTSSSFTRLPFPSSGQVFELAQNKYLSTLPVKNKMAPSEIQDHLYRARFQFQNGQYKQALASYQKIERTSLNYLKSREEMGWTYLHLQDIAALRGLTLHVNSSLVPFEDRMESRVLSGIAALKTCDYKLVKKEIMQFQNEAQNYLKNLHSPKLNESSSNFIVETSRQNLLALKKQIEVIQKTKSLNNLKNRTVLAHQMAVTDWAESQKKYMRFQKQKLDEAILKMKFLRLELLTQLKLEQIRKNELGSTTKLASAENTLTGTNSKMVFKMDRDVWADEIFLARSLTNNLCRMN